MASAIAQPASADSLLYRVRPRTRILSRRAGRNRTHAVDDRRTGGRPGVRVAVRDARWLASRCGERRLRVRSRRLCSPDQWTAPARRRGACRPDCAGRRTGRDARAARRADAASGRALRPARRRRSGCTHTCSSPGSTGAPAESVARDVVDTAWIGRRLLRSDRSSQAPFGRGLCLLAVNTGFACERDLVRDAADDLSAPAVSPDGRLIAVARSPAAQDAATGPIVRLRRGDWTAAAGPDDRRPRRPSQRSRPTVGASRSTVAATSS